MSRSKTSVKSLLTTSVIIRFITVFLQRDKTRMALHLKCKCTLFEAVNKVATSRFLSIEPSNRSNLCRGGDIHGAMIVSVEALLPAELKDIQGCGAGGNPRPTKPQDHPPCRPQSLLTRRALSCQAASY